MEKSKLNKWQKVTLWFMAGISAVISVYDIFVAFFNDTERDTISRMIQIMAHDHWSLPFAVGAVFIGHFFLYGKPLMSQPWSFLVMVAIFGAFLLADILGFTPRLHPAIFLALGAIAGHIFWPMSPIR